MRFVLILASLILFSSIDASVVVVDLKGAVSEAKYIFEGKITGLGKGNVTILVSKSIKGDLTTGSSKTFSIIDRGIRIFPFIVKTGEKYLFIDNPKGEIVLLGNIEGNKYRLIGLNDWDGIKVNPNIVRADALLGGKTKTEPGNGKSSSWANTYSGQAKFIDTGGKEYSFPLKISIKFEKNTYIGTYTFTLPNKEEATNEFEVLKVVKQDFSGTMTFTNTYEFKGTKKGSTISGSFYKGNKSKGSFTLEKKEDKEEE